mgnify:CR=1 FL=1
MVVAYLVADNLHVEKLRARVGTRSSWSFFVNASRLVFLAPLSIGTMS